MNRRYILIALTLLLGAGGRSVAQTVDDSMHVAAPGDTTRIMYSSDSNKVYTKPVLPAPITIAKAKPVPRPKPPKPITNEWSLGLRLNTNGWSLYTDIGKVKANDMRKADMFHNLLFFQIEFGEKKDPKEQKVAGQTNRFGGSKYFKYGKINNFYALKLGLGYSKMLAGKPDPGCASIHWNTVGGFSLGLLKPYYLITA
ncbi:MAG: hypothetical protein EBZ77_14420, partial [Chitinophagia bacterium]|nr:hypothetical protein [Chitinophagia bacterium]